MSWLIRSLFSGFSSASAAPAEAKSSGAAQENSKTNENNANDSTELNLNYDELSSEYTILFQEFCDFSVFHPQNHSHSASANASASAGRSAELKFSSAKLFILQSNSNEFHYFLHLYSPNPENRKLLVQPINSAVQPRVLSSKQIAFSIVVDNQVRFFQFDFADSAVANSLLKSWFIALFESSRKERITKSMNAAEFEHALRGFATPEVPMDEESVESDAVPMDDMDFDEEKKTRVSTGQPIPFISPERPRRFEAAFSDSESDNEQEAAADAEAEDEFDTPTKNRSSIVRSTPGDSQSRGRRQQKYFDENDNLAVGITNLNRTFVGRGAQIGVFKHSNDGSLDFLSHIPAVKTVKGDLLTPSRMMLHEADRKMILLNPNDEERAYLFDLEAEKVISEFGGPEDFKIRNVAPTAKYAEATNEATFLGVNNVSVFMMDPRRSEKNKIAVKGEQMTPLSTCVTATGEGMVAVGSQRGEIRLYNDISKRAKSLLPGLGDPIIGIDVTENGRLILATTKNYLILINTEYEEGKKTGFKASMATKGSPPIKLQLAPADIIQYNIPTINFTEAHFNTGENINEKWILAASNEFLITWNLRKVLQGKLFDYKIKRLQSNVIADSFLFGRDDQVVVALSNDVMVEQRKIKPRQTR